MWKMNYPSSPLVETMYDRTYRFADVTVRLRTLYDQVHLLCSDYSVTDAPSVTVTVTQADIDYERQKADGIHSDPWLETSAAYRLLAEALTAYGVLLVHGSAIAVDGKGYLFTAKSGTGKSTHTRLWRQLLGDRAVMVNDDKPLVAVTDAGIWVYGTPWDGKHRLSTNMAVPLAGICLLSRGEENRIHPVPLGDGYAALLGQILRPRNPAMLVRMLELTEKLRNQTPLFAMECNMDIQAAVLAYETMRGADE